MALKFIVTQLSPACAMPNYAVSATGPLRECHAVGGQALLGMALTRLLRSARRHGTGQLPTENLGFFPANTTIGNTLSIH